jgi:hypothetical protein
MSDRKAPPSVFVDDSVDTRAPAPGIPAPVSTGDILGANWTLSRQDQIDAPAMAEDVAYAPLASALVDRLPTNWIGMKDVDRYSTPAGRGVVSHYKPAEIWEDIERIRASEPNFLADVPAKSPQEFTAWVKANELAKRRQAQDVVRRQSGFGQQALGFGAGMAASFQDPINLLGMTMLGPAAGGGRSLLSVAARDAVTNMAIETAELPVISSNRAQFGETMTPTDMLADVGFAGAAGAAFPLATHGIGAGGRALATGGRAVGDAIADSDVARSAQRYFAPWALGRANLDQVGDAEVSRMFSDSVPFEARTPEAQAGLYVMNRESEVRDASPYVATPGGLDANAEKLTATSDALSRPATLGNTSAPARPRGRITSPISQNSIIGFVMNDLEGGAKVVHYNDADGGVTKFGIAQKFNPGVDVANLTEAEAGAIARRRYWLPEFNNADPRVAAVAFDAGYINSPSLARRIIGEAGDDVDKAVSIYRDALNRIADRNPGKEKYRKGWMNRVDKLARFVGDADASSVRLAPEGFGDDEIAYRSAQEDLNRQELQLADDTPARPDPVRDYVDRLSAGDDVSATIDRQFASSNHPAIDAEIARRSTIGVDGHPDELGGGAPADRVVAVDGPSDAQTQMAVRHYVREAIAEPTPEMVAHDLGIEEGAARKALALVDDNRAVGPSYLQRVASVIRPRDAVVHPLKGPDLSAMVIDPAGKIHLLDTDHHDFREAMPPREALGYAAITMSRHELALRRAVEPTAAQDRAIKELASRGAREGRPLTEGGVTGVPEKAFPLTDYRASFSEEPAGGPPPLDPSTHGIADAGGAEARQVADSIFHDLTALALAGDDIRVPLVEGGPELSAADLVASLAIDDVAIAAVKACL